MKNLMVKPGYIYGKNLVFRNANKSDAEFIIGLRSDFEKGRYLSPTPGGLSGQIKWLEAYEKDHGQVYFVIENKSSESYGTVRLYNQVGNSFCWGSWILKEGSPSYFSIESVLMLYSFALTLGFNKSHFDVRKDNSPVWRFHERFGAARVGADDFNYYYEIISSDVTAALLKYKKYLPDGINIVW